MGAADSKGVLNEIREMIRSGEVKGEARAALTHALVAIGDESDLREVLKADLPDAGLLRGLMRRERPKFDVVPPLGRAILHPKVEARTAAVELAAHWRVVELYERVLQIEIGRASCRERV